MITHDRFRGMAFGGFLLGVLTLSISPVRADSITDCPSGGTGFTICAVYGSTITGNAQASTIESTIDAGIRQIESQFYNPVTVYISFDSDTAGAADGKIPAGDIAFNSTSNYVITYQQFINALDLDSSRPDDVAALMHLPNQANNPVTGITNMVIHSADAAALGISIPGVVSSATSPDGQAYLDLSVMNISRSNTPTNAQYDLETVAMHEIDEVLGLSSTLDQGFTGTDPQGNAYSNYVSPLDLFRYDANGNRSYTAGATSYFEVTPGTPIVQFNSTAGADYGEWQTTFRRNGQVSNPMVQNAIGAVGTTGQINLGANEIEALSVIGYDTLPVVAPEPSTWLLFGAGIAACELWRRRRA